MENLGNRKVRRDSASSRSHFIIGWMWFVGALRIRNVARDLRSSGGFSTRFDFASPLSDSFRRRRWRPIPLLVGTGSSPAMRQRARWISIRR